MKQAIIGFHKDEEGDWVANLGCGHTRHVRHNPPWIERPWVKTPEGRQRFLGRCFDCKTCDEERAAREATLDAALAMTFPASDPPSWMP